MVIALPGNWVEGSNIKSLCFKLLNYAQVK